MSSVAEIKGRMRSVAETKKVTDAMYMISSVKLRRAKREVQNTEPYFSALKEEIAELLRYIPEMENRYFRPAFGEDETVRRGLLLITADKGLVGGYNHTAIKRAEGYLRRYPGTELYIIGEFGRQYFTGRGVPFHKEFRYPADLPELQDAEKICIDLLDSFDAGQLGSITMIYTDYVDAVTSECREQLLLPLSREAFPAAGERRHDPYKEFYPDASSVLSEIVPSYLIGFIYASLVSGYCSEQQERMMAMNTAGKNADEMLKKLRTQFNSLRQAGITREMIEISSGAKALRAKREKQEAGNDGQNG